MTYKGKQYTGLSILGFAEKFISEWNNSLGDPKAQMRAIDYLLHRFHWEMTENPTRPVAVNFIDGTMSNVMQLILELAYSDDISRKNNKEEWLRNKASAERIWGNRKGD